MHKISFIFFSLLPIFLYSDSKLSDILDNRRHDSINIAVEVNSKVDYWNPGLSGEEGQSLLIYKTEGLNAVIGKVKLQLYDSDIASFEYFLTPKSKSSKNEYKKNQNKNAFAEGMRWSIHIGKIMAYLTDIEFLNGFGFEYTKRDFEGNVRISNNVNKVAYWHDDAYEDFYERNDLFHFHTKFTKAEFFYTYDDIWNNDYYVSVGAFDINWAKPSALDEIVAYGEIPVFFDARYHSQGLSFDIGKKDKNYDFNFYFDIGLNNEIDLTNNVSIDNILEDDETYTMYMAGSNFDYIWSDIYKTKFFTTDISIGGDVRLIQMGRDYTSFRLDGELNYGLNAKVEFIF